MSQENRRERTPVRSRKSGDTKRDLTVSSFMLALALVGVDIGCQFFWTTLQAHSDSVCGSWDKNGPIHEVTGFLGFMAWEKSYEPAVGLPRNQHSAVPDATSQNLGWPGYRHFVTGIVPLMNKMDSINTQYKESTLKISHPAIGEIYCLNEPEARATVHEIWIDELYLKAGISISAGDVVVDVGANIGGFTLYAAKQVA